MSFRSTEAIAKAGVTVNATALTLSDYALARTMV